MDQVLDKPLCGATLGRKAIFRLEWLGALFAVSLIVTGLVFRTYEIAVTPVWIEGLRQLGLTFLLCEMGVIFVALRNGFTVSKVFGSLGKPDRVALLVFLLFFLPGGLLVSPKALAATALSMTMLIHLLFGCALSHMIGEIRPRDIDRFGKVMAVGLVFFTAMIAEAFLFPPAYIDIFSTHWQFAVPGFISVRLFGAYVGALAAFFVVLAMSRPDNTRLDLWLMGAIALSWGLTVWSGTRGAAGAFVVVVLAIWLMGRLRPSPSRLAQIVACLSLGSIVAVASVPYGDTDFMLFHAGDTGTAESITSGRIAFWQEILGAIGQYPWLGAGSAASSWILPESVFQHVQPHNIILQFILSWGVVAGIAALFLLARATVFAHKVTSHKPLVLPFVAVIDCLLVNSLVDGTFYFARHLMLAMACFGIIFAVHRQATS